MCRPHTGRLCTRGATTSCCGVHRDCTRLVRQSRPGQRHRTATGNAFTAFSFLPNGSSPRGSRFTIRKISRLASASLVPLGDQGMQTRDLVLYRDFPAITGLYHGVRSRSSRTTVPVLNRHFPIIEDVKGYPALLDRQPVSLRNGKHHGQTRLSHQRCSKTAIMGSLANLDFMVCSL